MLAEVVDPEGVTRGASDVEAPLVRSYREARDGQYLVAGVGLDDLAGGHGPQGEGMMAKELAIVWDALTIAERRDVVLETSLPSALQYARWGQLTASERTILLAVDWESAVARAPRGGE
jgi:hypothetical protein